MTLTCMFIFCSFTEHTNKTARYIMKHLYLIIFLLITGTLAGQENKELINNFIKNRHNILYWQITYETELSQAELVDAIIESGYYEEIDVAGEKVVCVLRPYKVNFEQYGYSGLESSSYLAQSLITGTVIFEYKSGRYRVTIKNINLIDNTEDAHGIVSPLESLVLNRQQDIKFQFFKNGSDILNRDFSVKTSFQNQANSW